MGSIEMPLECAQGDSTTNRKPRDDEIDVYGLSDRGKVRARNEDHFLLASVHRRVNVIGTNLSEVDRLPLDDQRLVVGHEVFTCAARSRRSTLPTSLRGSASSIVYTG